MGIYEIFKWIYSFEKETKVNLHETVSDLKGEVLLRKNEKGLIFNFGYPHFKTLYNKEANFNIFHNSFGLKINHYLVKNDNQNFFQRICNAYMFQSLDFDVTDKLYHKYYTKIDDYFLMSFFSKWQKEFLIKVDGINFKISTCEISSDIKHTFICIECNIKIDFKKFKHYVNSIIVSIAFFSGKFFKLEEIYFQSKIKNFSKSTDFFYRNSNTKYSLPNPITNNPKNWDWKFKDDFVLTKTLERKWSSSINKRQFILLTTLLIEKPKLYFSIRNIFEFYKSPVMTRIPIMFVVLETICVELKKASTEFIEKSIIKNRALDILLRNEENITSEDYIELKNAINYIDKKLVGNIINYEKAFKSLNLDLSEEDKKVLSKRNLFFHGSILPDDALIQSEEDFYKIEKEYNYYSNKLYVLITKLILKQLNFTGYLVNYPKMFEDETVLKVQENYFIKI